MLVSVSAFRLKFCFVCPLGSGRTDSEEESVCRGNVSCMTAVSKVSLRPTPRDDGARFACEAEHPAIGGAAPGRMRVAVVLSVQCE